MNNFDELMYLLLNPNKNWILEKNKISLKENKIEIFFNKYHNINFYIDHIPLSITDEERKILAKAIIFINGNKPKSIYEAIEENLVDFTGFSISNYYPIGGRKAIKSLILQKNKSKSKQKIENEYLNIPKVEDIFKSTGFGTIGDLFNNLQQNDISYDSELERDEKPYFKVKQNKKNETQIKIFESLVLWDIENVNFFDDVTKISRYLKNENQLKCVSFYQKHKSSKIFIAGDINFKLTKLRKRNWVVSRTKGIADNTLIEYFHKYKYSLKELILITADSDFNSIAKEAKSLRINVIIINNANIENNAWFKDYEYVYLN